MARMTRVISSVGLTIALLAVVSGAQSPQPATAPAGRSTPPFWTYEDFRAGRVPQTWTIRKGHPRLLITPDNRQAIIARAAASGRLFQAVIDQAEKGSGEPAALACAAIYQLGIIDGFKYALSREEYGRKGVGATMALIGDASMEDFETYTGSRLGVPCGYDWLFPLLTDEQKRALVKELIRLTEQETLDGGRGPESSEEVFCPCGTLSRPHCPFGGHRMTMGLAFHGDGIDDKAAERIADETFKRVWWNPELELTYGTVIHLVRYLEGGGWFEGLTHLGDNAAFFPHMAAWKTATGQDYFARLGYFRALPYIIAHSNVPKKKGEPNCTLPLMRFYSLNAPGTGSDSAGVKKMLAAATGYLSETDPAGARLAQWLLQTSASSVEPQDRIGGMESLPDDDKLVFALLMGDPRVPAASPEDLKLPLTLHMPGMNIVHMRSSWTDPDATMVGFADNQFAAYAAEASNAFSLWKNQAALLPYRGQIAGAYEYIPSATPDNNLVGYYNTDNSFWAPSVLKPAFAVPKAAAPPRPRDRGSATRMEGFDLESVPDEFDFMNSTMETDTYRRYLLRTLIYLRAESKDQPEFVVLRDRTDTYYTSVLQSATEPRIGPDWDTEGKARALSGGAWGEPTVTIPGQWEIAEAPCITVTNAESYRRFPGPRQAHARAFIKVLYPESIKITKIGGPGHEMDFLADRRGAKSGGSNLWRDIGVTDPSVSDKLAFGGFWRLIVWPGGRTRTRTILQVIEPTDSAVERPHLIRLLKCPDAVAAQAGPNVVLFGIDHQPLRSAKVVTETQTARILAADIPPRAECTLTVGKDSRTVTATAAGVVFLKGLRLPAGETIEVTIAQPVKE